MHYIYIKTYQMAAVTLRAIPEDIFKYFLQQQLAAKMEKKRGQYSIEKTVYKIVREHKELTEKK